MKAILLAALLATCALPASADTYLNIAGVSYHGDRSGNWNEKNPGIGIEHDGYIAGYYRNSYNKDTVYAGYAWRPLQAGAFKAGVIVAAASGYHSPVVAMPSVVVGGDKVALEFVGAPAVGKSTTWFVGATLRLKLN